MNWRSVIGAPWRHFAAIILRALRRWPWLRTVRMLLMRFREDRLGLTAGSLTFTTLISLVPLVTVMLAVFSAFPMFERFRSALEQYFLQALIPPSIARPVLSALTEFASKAESLGTAGVVALVFTAVALMLTIDRTLNSIWRVREPRPIAQRVLVYWAAVTLGPLLLGISLSLTSYALSASQGFVGAMPGAVSLVLNGLEFTLLALGVSGLFHFVPNIDVRWRHALAGGVFVAIGFELAKRLLGLYLRIVPTYAMVYGAFATLPIFLLWIYLGWVIVLLGAIIAAYAPSLQMRVVRRPDTPGAAFQLATSVLRLLAGTRVTPPHGLTLSELSARLRVDPLQIEPLLETLAGIGWTGRMDSVAGGRHVLLCDLATERAAPLLSALLIERSGDVAAFWREARFDELRAGQLIENDGSV